MELSEEEFDIERARRSKFDASGIFRRKEDRSPNWHTIIGVLVTIVVYIVTVIWYGGRLSQRVDSLEAALVEARQRDAELVTDNGRQNVTLGIIGQQYGDISRRLENIERKLDRR